MTQLFLGALRGLCLKTQSFGAETPECPLQFLHIRGLLPHASSVSATATLWTALHQFWASLETDLGLLAILFAPQILLM